MNRKHIGAVFTACVLAVAMAQPAQGTPKDLSKKFAHTVTFSFVADIVCGSKGQTVNISAKRNGDPGASGWFIFGSPSGNTATEPQEFKAELLYGTDTQTRGASGKISGVGGNPWIYVETKRTNDDDASQNTDGLTLLGRCVQDFLHVTKNGGDSTPIDFPVSARLTAGTCSPKASSLGWSNGKGHDPIHHSVTVWLDNKAPDNPSDPRPHQGAVSVSVSLDPIAGGSADQKVNGIGGNPLVFVNLAKSNETPTATNYLTDPNWLYAGRCKDLM